MDVQAVRRVRIGVRMAHHAARSKTRFCGRAFVPAVRVREEGRAMTHKSSVRYGAGQPVESHSGGRSGPVRVRYFDPVTGEPCAEKPVPLGKRKQSRPQMCPGAKPSNMVAVTVDGVRYESMRAAAYATGISASTLQMARKMGWGRIGDMAVEFER